MEFKIKKAILHILDNNSSMPIFSQKELNLEGSIDDFIAKHVKKTILDDNAKQSRLDAGSFLYGITESLADQGDFVQISIDIAEKLYSIMKSNVAIPNADILIALITLEGQEYLTLIKFNYKEGFTHYVDYDEEGTSNQIILHKALFPSDTQKTDESAIINIHEKLVILIEKPYEINGEKQNYFSELFLECKPSLSPKQSLKIVNEAAAEIGKKYFSDSFETSSKLKTVLYEAAESTDAIDVEVIADKMFADKPEIREEYIEEVKKAGLVDKVPIQSKTAEKKLAKQKIKTDDGIELSIPMEIYKDKDKVEFINHADGTISLLIKNISKLISK